MSRPSEPAVRSMPQRDRDARLTRILEDARVVAVIGMSPDPERDSHGVGRYLRDQGYFVIPVHTEAEEIDGMAVYPDLDAVPDEVEVDVVDVFVAGPRHGPLVEQAAATGAPVIWFQPGAGNDESEARARAAGLEVVAGACARAEHRRLLRGDQEEVR